MKKILNISLIMFVILFQLKSFAEEKNYHKELITDWSRIFPDKNRNAAGPKFFKYIIDKKLPIKTLLNLISYIVQFLDLLSRQILNQMKSSLQT